jgi:hypothetical protein
MRRALISSLAAALMAACGYGYETRTTTITGAPMITSGPALGEPELPRTFRAASERLAGAVCMHEQRCGRGEAVPSCVSATAKRARNELMRWDCEPAAARARLEECLAGLDAQPCPVNLRTDTRQLCPPVVGCGDLEAKLIPPGRVLAKYWKEVFEE